MLNNCCDEFLKGLDLNETQPVECNSCHRKIGFSKVAIEVARGEASEALPFQSDGYILSNAWYAED